MGIAVPSFATVPLHLLPGSGDCSLAYLCHETPYKLVCLAGLGVLHGTCRGFGPIGQFDVPLTSPLTIDAETVSGIKRRTLGQRFPAINSQSVSASSDCVGRSSDDVGALYSPAFGDDVIQLIARIVDGAGCVSTLAADCAAPNRAYPWSADKSPENQVPTSSSACR